MTFARSKSQASFQIGGRLVKTARSAIDRARDAGRRGHKKAHAAPSALVFTTPSTMKLLGGVMPVSVELPLNGRREELKSGLIPDQLREELGKKTFRDALREMAQEKFAIDINESENNLTAAVDRICQVFFLFPFQGIFSFVD